MQKPGEPSKQAQERISGRVKKETKHERRTEEKNVKGRRAKTKKKMHQGEEKSMKPESKKLNASSSSSSITSGFLLFQFHSHKRFNTQTHSLFERLLDPLPFPWTYDCHLPFPFHYAVQQSAFVPFPKHQRQTHR